jgi:iron complex outermembrane recepter protein
MWTTRSSQLSTHQNINSIWDSVVVILASQLGHFGFSVNYKWIKGFVFEGSPQFTGFVPTYDMFDAQISYRIPSNLITFKLGASNLFGIQPLFENGSASERFGAAFDNRNYQVYGGPKVGRMAYFSVLFEWN